MRFAGAGFRPHTSTHHSEMLCSNGDGFFHLIVTGDGNEGLNDEQTWRNARQRDEHAGYEDKESLLFTRREMSLKATRFGQWKCQEHTSFHFVGI